MHLLPASTSLRLTFCAGLMALLAAGPVLADPVGSATSSASSAGSASVGSLSDSVQGSSTSSTGDKKMAAGEYRVAEVTTIAAADGMPARLELRMNRVVSEGADANKAATNAATNMATTAQTWVLRVPAQALAAQPVQPGDHLWVHERAYGLAFARVTHNAPAAPQRVSAPFFLALNDAWLQDIQARPVSL